LTFACGTAAPNADDDAEGALSVMPPEAPALHAKIDECTRIADATERLRCIAGANTAVIATIDAAARSNWPQEAVIDFPSQVDTFRESEQWFCHARAGLDPTSEERSSAIDACLAARELSFAKVIVQTFYKYNDVKLVGPLPATCPKPEVPATVVDPNNEFLAGREARAQEAVLEGWAECYRTAVKNDAVGKVKGSAHTCLPPKDNPPPGSPKVECDDTPVLDFAVNQAVNICGGIANGAWFRDTHKSHLGESECAALSLFLLAQDIDAK
jgi:hypothetical protein